LTFFLYEFHLLELHIGPLQKFPPRIIGSTGIVPFIDINGVISQRFDIGLHFLFQAINSSQYADNAENTDGYSKQRQKSTEFIGPKFLGCHSEAGKQNIQQFNHSPKVQCQGVRVSKNYVNGKKTV
jgi:hypothetical protein